VIAIVGAGRSDTLGSRAPGVAAGPIIVRVTAQATARGQTLAEYDFRMDVEPGGVHQDIGIPASAVVSAGTEKPEI
jgi:hypothetical protein